MKKIGQLLNIVKEKPVKRSTSISCRIDNEDIDVMGMSCLLELIINSKGTRVEKYVADWQAGSYEGLGKGIPVSIHICTNDTMIFTATVNGRKSWT